MKKALLVTVATSNYTDHAKQLFSGVYFNGGWQGDYMLLAHDIPEEKLKWFRNKGILIKKCQPLSDKKMPYHPVCVLDKFYLFTPEFKKWDNIVYIDSDVLVRASIEKIADVKGFAAVHDFSSLRNQFFGDTNKLHQNAYDLERPAFNTGFMVFDTNVITENMFEEMKALFEKYASISRWGEQGLLNLFFYKRWKRLPALYNIHYKFFIDRLKMKPEKIKGVMVHLLEGNIPRKPQDDFYDEWMDNLKRADDIDLDKRLPAAGNWTSLQAQLYFLGIIIRHPDYYWWFFKLFINNYFYLLYFLGKKVKRTMWHKNYKRCLLNE
jgi:lipopolysaccharide biosynthesis glycosyltransferase